MNLPLESKCLGYKWIFKKKMKVNRSIDKQDKTCSKKVSVDYLVSIYMLQKEHPLY